MPKKNPDNEPDQGNKPDPGNVGVDSGKGSGSGSPASESQEGRTWTRGDDPENAAEELRKANRGSTGGELNQPVPKNTPRA
jgi:hypothetical protein